MRLKRHKICVDDFELLTIIGRGAFGEVWSIMLSIYSSGSPSFIKISLFGILNIKICCTFAAASSIFLVELAIIDCYCVIDVLLLLCGLF